MCANNKDDLLLWQCTTQVDINNAKKELDFFNQG